MFVSNGSFTLTKFANSKGFCNRLAQGICLSAVTLLFCSWNNRHKRNSLHTVHWLALCWVQQITVGSRAVAYSQLTVLLLVNPVSCDSYSPYQLIYLLKTSSVNAPRVVWKNWSEKENHATLIPFRDKRIFTGALIEKSDCLDPQVQSLLNFSYHK